MVPARLHDIDPDVLFETRSVEEVEFVQKSITQEIEKKKEDLRTLVGERYRDLIEAADKIKEMKELSNRVIRDVDDINSSLVGLQRKYQGSAYPDNASFDSVGRQNSSILDAVAAQISIMIELPEMIWSAVGDKDYLKAAQLFLLGRHIKTSFDVDRKYRERVQGMVVLEDLWRALAHFPRTIADNAETDLRCVDVSHRTAAVCIASIHLLQNVSVLDRFLSLRTESLASVLEKDQKVQEGILGSCACIINTLSLLKTCFVEQVETGNGLVWQKLNLVSRNHSPINLLERTISMGFLPPVITNFKLSSVDNASLPSSSIESSVGDWLDLVKSLVTEKGSNLLGKVGNLQELNSLKSGYSLSDVEWDSLMDCFKVKTPFKLWDGLYKPILAQRTKELISALCEATYKDVTRHINEALVDEDSTRSDMDLRWFIWKEAEDDLETQGSTSKGVLLKSKAIVPKVANICHAFENKLSGFYKDLAGFYNTEDIMSSENVELRNHQQSMCLNIVLKLKEFVRDLVAQENINESKLSVIARFLQAIPDLCPMLQKCLTLGETRGNTWHEVKLLLNSESMFCWTLWEERTLKRMKMTYLPQMLKKNESYADLLNVIPQWEIMWIEEDGDHKSQLKVPSAPSLRLQAALHKIMTDLSRIHLPRLINESVTQKILPLMFEAYDPSAFICPSEAFQALFDLKYLAALYIPLTNKNLTAACHEKISSLESAIDPIDLEVFSPLIRNKVKESVHRTQGMFSTSYSAEENINLKIGDDPCILALSKSASAVWFPSLPLTNPSNRPLHIIKPKAVKLGKQINEMESSKSSSLSAASFFSDWFG
uniref:Conserved oligomeric Golgi complex subunit 1 n=1 Tax=Lygus hesperus TaxID=30085 RepID=A0A0K8T4P4_LYGHE